VKSKTINNLVSTKSEDRLIHLLALLGDATRFKIFKIMLNKSGLCVTEIATELGISVSAASQSFKQFELLGVVSRERLGKKICYTLNTDDNLVKRLIEIVSIKEGGRNGKHNNL
jgi:predicted transcriptional regulator